MRTILSLFWLLFTGLIAFADEPAVHQIGVSGEYLPPGRPASGPHLLAVGGKPLRLNWMGGRPATSVPIRVDRITAARRIPVAKGETTLDGQGWSWEWTPPITRSVVIYEVTLNEKVESAVRIDVRDPQWMKDLLTKMQLLQWESANLSRDELAALASVGLRKIIPASRSTGSTTTLSMISTDPGATKRRVIWDQDQPDLVVWRPGPAAGDLDIRAPRWWISPAALATDEGLIRLLDLFSEPPANP